MNVEIQKIKRTYDYAVGNSVIYDKEKSRKEFFKFVQEYDKRRGTDFSETFPQLTNMYAKNK